MVGVVKEWISSRGRWMTQTLLRDESRIPETPTLTYAGPQGYPSDGLVFNSSNFVSPSRSRFAGMEWRLAEVHNPEVANYNPDEPNIYEIAGSFESGELNAFARSYQFPPVAVEVGRTYRVRVRLKDVGGRWSHWSLDMENGSPGCCDTAAL